MMNAAVQHDSAADPGSDRKTDHMTGATGSTDPTLAQQGTVGVVVEHNREVEPIPEVATERHVRPAEVGGQQDDSVLAVEGSRSTGANAQYLCATHSALQLGAALQRHLDHITDDLVGPSIGRCASLGSAHDVGSVLGHCGDHQVGAADVDAEHVVQEGLGVRMRIDSRSCCTACDDKSTMQRW